MTIQELETLMVKHGAVIRAIPQVIISKLSPTESNKAMFPNGRVEYVPEFGREMLVVKKVPKHAGKFIITSARGTSSHVFFPQKPAYFDSVEDAAASLEKQGEPKA